VSSTTKTILVDKDLVKNWLNSEDTSLFLLLTRKQYNHHLVISTVPIIIIIISISILETSASKTAVSPRPSEDPKRNPVATKFIQNTTQSFELVIDANSTGP